MALFLEVKTEGEECVSVDRFLPSVANWNITHNQVIDEIIILYDGFSNNANSSTKAVPPEMRFLQFHFLHFSNISIFNRI